MEEYERNDEEYENEEDKTCRELDELSEQWAHVPDDQIPIEVKNKFMAAWKRGIQAEPQRVWETPNTKPPKGWPGNKDDWIVKGSDFVGPAAERLQHQMDDYDDHEKAMWPLYDAWFARPDSDKLTSFQGWMKKKYPNRVSEGLLRAQKALMEGKTSYVIPKEADGPSKRRQPPMPPMPAGARMW